VKFSGAALDQIIADSGTVTTGERENRSNRVFTDLCGFCPGSDHG
jgi:hypothetical protein